MQIMQNRRDILVKQQLIDCCLTSTEQYFRYIHKYTSILQERGVSVRHIYGVET